MELSDYGIVGAIKSKTVGDAVPGDVVRFDKFSICVEKVEKIRHDKTKIYGRISIGCCDFVARTYRNDQPCRIEKLEGAI